MARVTIASLQARVTELEDEVDFAGRRVIELTAERDALLIAQRPSRQVVADTHNRVVCIRGVRYEKVPSLVGGRTVFTYKELA